MLDQIIWLAAYAIYIMLYLLGLGAVGMMIEIFGTLREGWSGENSQI